MRLPSEPPSVQPLLLCTLHPPALRRAVPQPGGATCQAPSSQKPGLTSESWSASGPTLGPASFAGPRTGGESAGLQAPWGHGGLLTRARPGPPLHVAWGCSPDPRHRPEETGAGLQGRRSKAGKREEPSPWPLTEAHLDPKSQIQQRLFSPRLTLVRTPSSRPHSRLPDQCPPPPRGAAQISR